MIIRSFNPFIINGLSGWKVFVSGIDGSVAGAQDAIRFQVTAPSNSGSYIWYDNQSGPATVADPPTPVDTGNIRIQ